MDARLRDLAPEHPVSSVLQMPVYHEDAAPKESAHKESPRDYSWLPDRVSRGLRSLLEAHQYAADLGSDDWEFAIPVASLRSEGLTDMDLRWMVQAGLVDFAYDVSLPGETKRHFRRAQHLVSSETLCLTLSTSGVVELAAWFGSQSSSGNDEARISAPTSAPVAKPAVQRVEDEPTLETPRWDRDRQELRVGKRVVKRFKAPAANQETILAAFEEEGWPPRIDDPLSPSPDLAPKRRLHDTINSLNRNQKSRLIRFFGDGSGTGIRWEFVGQIGDK